MDLSMLFLVYGKMMMTALTKDGFTSVHASKLWRTAMCFSGGFVCQALFQLTSFLAPEIFQRHFVLVNLLLAP